MAWYSFGKCFYVTLILSINERDNSRLPANNDICFFTFTLLSFCIELHSNNGNNNNNVLQSHTPILVILYFIIYITLFCLFYLGLFRRNNCFCRDYHRFAFIAFISWKMFTFSSRISNKLHAFSSDIFKLGGQTVIGYGNVHWCCWPNCLLHGQRTFEWGEKKL